MNISVIPTAQQAQNTDFSGKTAVVIDVLRATSVITTALENGAKKVIPVKTVEEAQSLFATCKASQTLCGGERNALKIEGFDLGNSPLEYKKKVVEDKTLILTTTNGTNAINNIKGANEVVLACFRNVEAVAKHILVRLPQCDSPTQDLVIVCAGTEGRFSLDDGLCTGMLIELIKQKVQVETDDFGLLLAHYYVENQANLLGGLAGCHHVKRLFTLGFYDDIKFCLEANCVETVPIVNKSGDGVHSVSTKQ